MKTFRLLLDVLRCHSGLFSCFLLSNMFDGITTYIGHVYFGLKEINPLQTFIFPSMTNPFAMIFKLLSPLLAVLLFFVGMNFVFEREYELIKKCFRFLLIIGIFLFGFCTAFNLGGIFSVVFL